MSKWKKEHLAVAVTYDWRMERTGMLIISCTPSFFLYSTKYTVNVYKLWDSKVRPFASYD